MRLTRGSRSTSGRRGPLAYHPARPCAWPAGEALTPATLRPYRLGRARARRRTFVTGCRGPAGSWWQARDGVPGVPAALRRPSPRPPGCATGLTGRGFAGTADPPVAAGPIVSSFRRTTAFQRIGRQSIGRLSRGFRFPSALAGHAALSGLATPRTIPLRRPRRTPPPSRSAHAVATRRPCGFSLAAAAAGRRVWSAPFVWHNRGRPFFIPAFLHGTFGPTSLARRRFRSAPAVSHEPAPPLPPGSVASSRSPARRGSCAALFHKPAFRYPRDLGRTSWPGRASRVAVTESVSPPGDPELRCASRR